MGGRHLTQRQRERIERGQQHRRARAERRWVEGDAVGPDAEKPGLLIAHHGRLLVVEDAAGDLHRCAARQNLGRLACGDRVIWRASGQSEGVIVAVAERRSLLVRPDYRGQPRPVAANLDAVAVVLASEPEFSEALIDRYLVAIAAMGVPCALVLNKVDLLDAAALALLRQRLEPYRRLGYPLLPTSNLAAQGLADLAAWLRGRTSLLAGQSGVGKSSLIKALLPDQAIRIRAVSHVTGHGAHTTSGSTLYHLSGGGDLIDSPGARGFELPEIGLDDLNRGFADVSPYLGRCRFADCRHEVEPDCALRTAAATGVIDPRRLQSYRQLRAALTAKAVR